MNYRKLLLICIAIAFVYPAYADAGAGMLKIFDQFVISSAAAR